MPVAMAAAGSRVVSTLSISTASTAHGKTATPAALWCGTSGPATLALT